MELSTWPIYSYISMLTIQGQQSPILTHLRDFVYNEKYSKRLHDMN